MSGVQRLRIAILYTPLTTPGGAERQMLEEVRWLRQIGHEVAALTFALSDDALFVEGIGREAIDVLPARGRLARVIALHRALRRRFDVLVSHTSPELTWLATRGLRLPYLVYHNDIPFGAERQNVCAASRRYRRVFRSVRKSVAGYAELEPRRLGLAQPLAELRTLLKHVALREARSVIVPSERSRRELRLLHGIEPVVVRGCLPSTLVERAPAPSLRRPPPRNVPVVLSVCRLAPMKRVDLLIRAFAHVRAAVPDALLVVVGQGPEHDRLVALAESLALGSAVRFVGYVPDKELLPYYAAADVFAAPILADFAIAPYEALAHGCPVVWTTDVERDPALEASGQVFVAPPEEEAFAAAILRALRGPPAGSTDLRSMTWENRAHRIAELCQQAVRRNGVTPRWGESTSDVRDVVDQGMRS